MVFLREQRLRVPAEVTAESLHIGGDPVHVVRRGLAHQHLTGQPLRGFITS